MQRSVRHRIGRELNTHQQQDPVLQPQAVHLSQDWPIIGHTWAAKRLSRAIEFNTLAQSILLVGAHSIGKTTLALALARVLLALPSGDRVRVNKLVDENRHPDLSWIRPDGGIIKVEPIRELLHTLALFPVESAYRVAIIERADLLHDAAKNAFLKTLEEPNPAVVLVLTAPSVESVLPTMASRCQVMTLRSPAQALIEHELVRRGAPQSDAERLAKLANRRIGWAIAAQRDNDMLSNRLEQLRAFVTALNADMTGRFAYAEQMAKQDRDVIGDQLEQIMFMWRDAMRQGLVSALQAFAAMGAVASAKSRIERDLNIRLALDVMMFDIPTGITLQAL